MKRIIAPLLALTILLSLPGCEAAPVETLGPIRSTVPTQEPTEPVMEALPAVMITEVMPDNETLCLGHDRDWVELYNAGEVPAELQGFYLTDDLTRSSFQNLSGLVIPAEGYLAVPLDGTFGLSASGETVYLIYGETAVSSLTYGEAQAGETFGPEGLCAWPTPGFANTEGGYYSYLESIVLPELTISEVLASNSKFLPVGLECYDLVEVMNNSAKAISLAGYGLSDKSSNPIRYRFPEVTLQPGEYYVVYCSDDASLGENHAPFKISAQGETLYLSKDGILTDVLTVPGDLQENESYGRAGNIPGYLEHPTFGGENAPGYPKGVAAPVADLPTGLYEEAVSVTLSGEGTIYYTTDGSRPTVNATVYTQPITVMDVTTIRTLCVNGSRSSEIASYTYVVGKEHDLPIVTVAIPEKSLTGSRGVLDNIHQTYEYEAQLTLIEDGEEKFTIPCGFRLHGIGSRKCPKQNFQLRFRGEYGATKLHYKVFDDRQIDTFDSLLLRGGSEDWNKAIMRDELATQVANGTTNLYTQAMKPVVLYLGDEYWGIYYIRERFSDDYVASHLRVTPESVDLLYSTWASVQSGRREDFRALQKFVEANDMTKEENYQYVAQRIDVLSLMDWYICRTYMGDKDPGNIRCFRSAEHDGLWRWMYFDLDWAFVHVNDQPIADLAYANLGEPRMFRAVIASKTGQDVFLKRYAELMGTVLNEEYFNQVIDEIVAAIESEVPRDRARWGRTVSNWEKSVQALRDYVNNGRRDKNVLADLKSYFGLSQAEMEAYFGDVMP